MTDDKQIQLGTLLELVGLVRNQSSTCLNMLSVSNKNSESSIELQKSTSDMLITLNSLLTTSLTFMWSELEDTQEQDYIDHTLTVEELDDEYDSDLDG